MNKIEKLKNTLTYEFANACKVAMHNLLKEKGQDTEAEACIYAAKSEGK